VRPGLTRPAIAARLPEIALGALMALAATVLLRVGHGLTFFGDEWNFILTRRGDGINDLLDAHVQHFSLVPVVIYRAMFVVFGIDHYGPYRVATVVLHLVCVALLYALARQRLGAWAGLVAVVPVLFLGRAHEDLIWAFQVGFLSAIAAGLGALLALRRGTRRGDIAATLLLCVSLASSGVGIPFFVVAVVQVALNGFSRRWWVALVPLWMYLLWYSGYGEPSAQMSNLPAAPLFAATMIAGATGALVGLGLDFGRMVALLGAWGAARAAAGSRVVRNRVLPPLCGVLAFAVSTGLARADNETPSASRYVYPTAVLIVLIAIEVVPGRRAGRRALVAAAAVAAIAALTNLTPLQDAAEVRREQADAMRASLAGIELARDTVPQGFALQAGAIEAHAYLKAIDDWGSPAYTPAELATRPEGVRAQADSVLLAALPLRVQPGVQPAGRCTTPPRGPGGTVDLVLPPGGFTVLPGGPAPVELRARVFAQQFPNGPTTTLGPAPARVELPPGRPRPDAHVLLTAGRPVRICG
jgi:hypothetical protein